MVEITLLGLLDEAVIGEDDNKLGWFVNKFGGIPNWMDVTPVSYPKCDLCQELLYLVAQIYCPLQGSSYHRTLYAFGCANPMCWNKPGSWKTLRSQCKEKEEAKKLSSGSSKEEESTGWNSSTWCEGADDWGIDDGSIADSDILGTNCKKKETFDELGELQEKTAAVAISEYEKKQAIIPTIESVRTDTTDKPFFDPYYISVIQEPGEDASQFTKHELELLREYERREGSVKDLEGLKDLSSKSGNETYEKTQPKHGDKSFHQFHKRISRCPGQCLRYQWNGDPLLFSDKNKPIQDPSSVLRCPYCNSTRMFELQLMPTLAWFLQGRKSLPATNNDKKDESIARDRIMHPSTNNVAAARSFNMSDKSVQSEIGTENISACSETITDFKNANEKYERTRIEFGTVFVYTCSNSCWTESDKFLREEVTVLQSDPDTSLFA